MNDLLKSRLYNQQISQSQCGTAQEVVSRMGAMQAQEYAMTKWAIGIRFPDSTDQEVEAAFNKGLILRTHLLRPTWHFVTPADIRWIVSLTAPRIHAASAFMYRQCGLEKKIFSRSERVIAKALEGGNFLTRGSLQAILKKGGIDAKGFRLGYLMMHAELECIICSGPRVGNQFTYALFDERAPRTGEVLGKAEALERLTRLYFGSRGPATVHDYATWSGLTIKEVKQGIEMMGQNVFSDRFEGKEYISLASTKRRSPTTEKLQTSFLMPDYDEYGMGYKDRAAILPTQWPLKRAPTFNRMIVIDGTIKGVWKRFLEKKSVRIETIPLGLWTNAEASKVKQSVKKFAKFLCLPLSD